MQKNQGKPLNEKEKKKNFKIKDKFDFCTISLDFIYFAPGFFNAHFYFFSTFFLLLIYFLCSLIYFLCIFSLPMLFHLLYSVSAIFL